MTRRQRSWQGMNWCRPSTRLAIYLRDGLACVWCGEGVEHGAKLTLDHVVPVERYGQNTPGNLVTACHRCNSARGSRLVSRFARAVARVPESARRLGRDSAARPRRSAPPTASRRGAGTAQAARQRQGRARREVRPMNYHLILSREGRQSVQAARTCADALAQADYYRDRYDVAVTAKLFGAHRVICRLERRA